MNQVARRLIGIVLTTLLIMLIPAISFATNITKEEVQIVQINEGKCMIYIKGLENTEFNYALFLYPNTSEMELKYIHSVKDGEGNQVALVEKSDFDFETNKKAYLKIKQGSEIKEVEIDFADAFKKEKMEEVENTTKRIQAEVVDNLPEEDKIDENGVHITVKVGGVKITDSPDATYYSQTKIAENEYAELMNLAKKIKNEYSNMDMFTRIQVAKEFDKLYNTVIDEATWQEVEDMTIKQPKEATENSEYVVLIQKATEGETITDVQFLTCKEEQIPTYEKEQIITQETAKLPITGDNVILIVAFIIVVIALVLVFIKMKKNKEKESK